MPFQTSDFSLNAEHEEKWFTLLVMGLLGKQEISRESSRQLTVLLAEGTQEFDRKQLQLVKVGKDGPCQEFRSNLAAFSKFLSKFWETKWLDGLVAPEFAEQKDLAVKLMRDLQKRKNLCEYCKVSYFGTYCKTCSRCPCGYTRNSDKRRRCRCATFKATEEDDEEEKEEEATDDEYDDCQRCGQPLRPDTFCDSCGYCIHGFLHEPQASIKHCRKRKQLGCNCQAVKKAAKHCPKTCKKTLASAEIKLDAKAGDGGVSKSDYNLSGQGPLYKLPVN